MHRNQLAVLIAGVVVVGVVAVGAVAALDTDDAPTEAQEEVTDPQEESIESQTIHVSATGEAEAAPDRALIRVAVTAEGADVSEVRDELARDAENVTGALDDLGVEYESRDYDIRQPRRHPEQRDVSEYVGQHSFTITVDSIDRTGEVIDTAATAGAEVGGVSLTLSQEQRTALRDEAIAAAMDDARHQADTIAANSGLQIENVSTVDAGQRRFVPVEYDDAAETGAAQGAAPPTRFVSGDVSVTYTVDVTYAARTA